MLQSIQSLLRPLCSFCYNYWLKTELPSTSKDRRCQYGLQIPGSNSLLIGEDLAGVGRRSTGALLIRGMDPQKPNATEATSIGCPNSIRIRYRWVISQ